MENEGQETEDGVAWVVHCSRHGDRAHVTLKELQEPTPELTHCSLRPDEFPPSCDQACMSAFKFKRAADEDTDLEDTVAY
jgi:hypothetical protein